VQPSLAGSGEWRKFLLRFDRGKGGSLSRVEFARAVGRAPPLMLLNIDNKSLNADRVLLNMDCMPCVH